MIRLQYTTRYPSPLGGILLAACDAGLTGLWFEGQKYFARGLDPAHEEKATPVLDGARRWLDLYFSGKTPGFTPPLRLQGTPFQQSVWKLLLTIPYGETTTYGALAQTLGTRSARAVGSAVGRNPVSIIVPCHRVLGSDGGLTGYAGGVRRKIELLRLEGACGV